MSRDSFHSLSSLLIEQNLARDADVAFLYNEKVSFSRFYADVCCLVEHLTGCDESKWAICTKDSYYFAVAFIALCHSRKEIVVPGNHKPSALLELSPNFDAILYDSLVQSDIGLDGVNLESFIFDPSSNLSLPAFDAENISITLYTSGSGGQPKAIKKTLLLFENELRQLHKIWGNFLQGKSFYSTVSHQHIYGLLFRVLYPLATGSAFDRRALEYPEQIINFSDKGAVLVSSPALIKRITLEEVIFYKSGYSAVFSSGGPLSFKAAQNCHKALGSLPIEVFGSTETGGIGYRQQEHRSSEWTLFPEVEARLSENGCIALRSNHIDPESWYQTTDKCELTDDRHFHLKGRTDRIVKLEEKRVSLVEVEKRLAGLREIADARVLVLDNKSRSVIAAVVELSLDGREKLNEIDKGPFCIELRKQLSLWLDSVAIPKQFRFVDTIPVNSQGKYLVSELSLMFEGE